MVRNENNKRTVSTSVIKSSMVLIIVTRLKSGQGFDEVLVDPPDFAACKFASCPFCGEESLNPSTNNI